MRAAITLLALLFSTCGAQSRSTQTEVQMESKGTGAAGAVTEVSAQLDIFAELQKLKEMVVLLTVTQNELQNTKTQMQSELEMVKMEYEAQKIELALLKERLNTCLTTVEAQQADLTNMKTSVMNLTNRKAVQEAELTAVKTRLADTETAVEDLERATAETPKVAFSAGLTNSGDLVAGSADLNLVFTKVITNVGQAYSHITGFFTAPVRGVYYFRYNVMDILPTGSQMTIFIYKNGAQVIRLDEFGADNWHTYLASGVTLQLELGDVVNLVLPAGRSLYDDHSNHSTFSGFLLFTL